MSDNTCTDCGHPIVWIDEDTERGGHAADEHPGLCCDCFDEGLGVPGLQRTRPR